MSEVSTYFNEEGLALFKQLLTPRLGDDFVLLNPATLSFIKNSLPEVTEEQIPFFGATGGQLINGCFPIKLNEINLVFTAIQEKIDAETEGGEIDGGGGGE